MKIAIACALAACLLSTVGCTDHRQYYFSGRVYDGVSGQRLTNYQLQLEYLDLRIDGQVSSDGRYFVVKKSFGASAIPVWNQGRELVWSGR